MRGHKPEYIGVGVGLRREHFDDVQNSILDVDWFEIISENFLTVGGKSRTVIDQLNQQVPIVPHGLSLSIASSSKIDETYIEKLSELITRLNSPWYSDHICMSTSNTHHYHDLLPALRTKESLNNIIDKVREIQKRIPIPLALENITYYVDSDHNKISEADFINEILEYTDSYLLLDINNVYVNSLNHNFSPVEYLEQINHERVIQIHLAGHHQTEKLAIDTHGSKISDEVWGLFRLFIKQAKRPISTLIEWDNELPSFKELNDEVLFAKSLIDSTITKEAA